MTRLQADGLLLFAALIWGTAFLFQKSAMAHVGPLTFIAARAVVAVIALLPVVLHEHRAAPPIAWRPLFRVAFPAGIAFFLGGILQQIGIVTASVTNTGFLTSLYVILTPLLAWLLMRQRPTASIWLSVPLSIVGVWLLGGGGMLGAFGFGEALVAVSALFWALHVVLLGIGADGNRPVLLTAVQFAVVAILGTACAAAFETITLAGLGAAAVDIAFVGILSSAVTFTLFTIAVRHTGPSEAAIIVSCETIFAAAAGWIVLGERLPLIGWLGAGLIIASILVVQLHPGMVNAKRERG
jgi:drug/metabolite transporter (DMT)-like permease